MLRRFLSASVVALVIASVAPARADIITLKNGREVIGKLVEEKKDPKDKNGDYVIVRVLNSGSIKILKKDIATFTENDDLGPKDKPLAVGATPTPGAEPPTSKKEDRGEITDDEKQAIAKLRKELEDQLAKLGKTAEERRKAAELTPEEAQFVSDRLGVINRNRQGQNLHAEGVVSDVANLGAKAVKPLADLLTADKAKVKKASAEGLARVGATEDGRWICYDQGVPQKLLTLLSDTGDEFSARARSQANAALEAITQKSVGWPTDEAGDFRSQAETEATAKWAPIVSDSVLFWQNSQKKDDDRRKKLADRLKLLDTKDWRDAFEDDSSSGGGSDSGKSGDAGKSGDSKPNK